MTRSRASETPLIPLRREENENGPTSSIVELKPGAHANREPATRQAPVVTTRLLSIVALAALVGAVLGLSRVAYLAVTDAWVAPLQLSPDSREVVTLRMQAAKEEEQRVRLETEITSIAAEIAAIERSVQRLRLLEATYAEALRFSTTSRDTQRGALLREKALLDQQRAIMTGEVAHHQAALQRAARNLDAGVITATDLAQVEADVSRTQVSLSEKELEHARVNSALAAASREASALFVAAGKPALSGRAARNASPEVMRFDELRINVELQVTRLEAEKRAAEARQKSAEASIESARELHEKLQSTPLFQATHKELDLAFVPYSELESVRVGDDVVTCRWFLLACRKAGRVKRVYPGEIATEDPWGSAARGRYVELELSDRSVVGERTLRVRSPAQIAAREAPLVLAP